MAGFIRGMDPRENMYVFAHAAGHHFRTRATKAASPRVSITLSKEGGRIQTSFIPLRAKKRTARDFGLAPILMLEK